MNCQAMVTDLVQKTFERFLWKDLEVAHVLKVEIPNTLNILTFLRGETKIIQTSTFQSQRELDIRLGCSWQVVVGEVYSFSVDYEQVDNSTI